MRFFILLTLFLSSSILLFSCCSPKALEYRDVSAFSISKLGITSSTVNMNIVYYNPNRFSMQLKRTDLDIFIDSNYVGHTTQQNQVTIPAQSEFNIPLTVDINMNTIFQNALAAFLVKSIKVKVSGNIRAGKAHIYKNFPVNYVGIQPFSFF
ncbi:MAG TPA: LEA type 2 family protein [Ferruginibacter sp.]|jgi:LEA14-like dessication related protein|nr:LEA type 2 family protein [Ferruginibacter sp.]